MEFKKYSWEDFFSFNDDTPLSEFEASIARMEKTYTEMKDVVVKANESILKSQESLVDQAKVVLKTVETTQIAQAGSADTMEDAAKSTATLAVEMKSLRDAEAANVKQISEFEKQLSSLNTTKEKARKVTDGEVNSLKALEKQLAEAIGTYKSFGDATDKSVKDSQLKKIKELSEQHKIASGALNDAKKSAVAAAGSYNELNNRVISAKKQLKEMGNGLENQSVEFKELQKFVAEGTEKLKGWDKAVGDSKREAGNYEGALKNLKIEFKAAQDQMIVMAQTFGTESEEFQTAATRAGALKDEIGDLTEAASTVAGSPLENMSSALGKTFGKLKAGDFSGAIDSARQFAKVGKTITFKEAANSVKQFGQTIGIVGKAILTNPLFLLAAVIIGIAIALYKLRDSLIPVKIAMNAIGAAIGFVVDMLKDFSDWLGISQFGLEEQTKAIVENAKKTIEMQTLKYERTIALAEAEGKAVIDLERAKLRAIMYTAQKGIDALRIKQKTVLGLNEEEKEDLAELIKAYDNAYQELRVLNAKTVTQYKKDAEEKLKAERAALIEVRKMRIAASIESQERIAANEFNGFQIRLDAIMKAERLRNQLILLERDKAVKEANGIVYKEVAAREEANRQIVASARAREAAQIALLVETDKKAREIFKRMVDANRALETERLNTTIWVNQQILKDEEASLDDRLSALMDMSDAQQALIEINSRKEMDAAREAGLSRVKIDEETYRAIFENTALSEEQRIGMLRGIQEQQLQSDQVYQSEVIRLTEDMNAKIQQLTIETANAAEDNVFKILARDAERLADSTDTLIAEGLIDLNAEFEKGEISAQEYQNRRAQIQENGQRVQLESQIVFLERQMQLFNEQGKNTADLERQIAEARLALSDQTANSLLAREQQLADAMTDLRQTATDVGFDILQSSFEKEGMALDERLAGLQERLDLELEMAGDNEAAKAILQNKFAIEQQRIEGEKARLARRAATFEKISAIFTIGVNTAIAVSKSIAAAPLTGGLPFSAITAALGALQIAAVLAKPIPAYAEGTDYHRGGLALFGEAGAELVERPGGAMSYHTQPTIGDLPAGSKVYNAKETADMLAANSLMAQAFRQYATDHDRLGQPVDAQTDQRMFQMISDNMQSLEETVKSKRELHVNITKKGVQKMIKQNDDWTEYLNQNYFNV
jgi:hypothetical protein